MSSVIETSCLERENVGVLCIPTALIGEVSFRLHIVGFWPLKSVRATRFNPVVNKQNIFFHKYQCHQHRIIAQINQLLLNSGLSSVAK